MQRHVLALACAALLASGALDASAQTPSAVDVVASPDSPNIANGAPSLLPRSGYPALGVETAPLARAVETVLAGLPGKVVVPTGQMFVATAPLGGRIEHVGVATGDPVRVGQVLARIASTAYAELQRGLLEAVARHRQVEDALDRDRKLIDAGIIAQSRFVASQTRFAESSAMLAERRQALRLAGMSEGEVRRLEAGETLAPTVNVVAPAAGVVLEQTASVGERVEATAALFRIARVEPLWIEIHAPVDRVRDVKEGTAVRVTGRNVTGRVIAIGRQVAAESQTLMLRVLVAPGGDVVRPGEHVEAQIVRPAPASDLWTVPNAAIVRQGERAIVFVENANGIAPREAIVVAVEAATSTIRLAVPERTRIAVKGIAGLRQALVREGGR